MGSPGAKNSGDRRNFADIELHGVQIAHDPGGFGGAQSSRRARVGQPAEFAFDGGEFPYFRFMTMSAANQVVVAGQRHGISIVRVVHYEDATITQRQDGVVSMVGQHSPRFCAQTAQRTGIAEVIAMDGVNGHADAEGRFQGVGADDVATVDGHFGAFSLARSQAARERLTVIMAVRNNAYFHGRWLGQMTRGPS